MRLFLYRQYCTHVNSSNKRAPEKLPNNIRKGYVKDA